jgi:thioredoxin 1
MQTSLIVTGLILAAFLILFIRARARMKNIPLVSDHVKILTLTDKNFQHQTRNKLVLVDFWAGWCAPCRMMGPVLNEVAQELNDQAHVGKVNIEQYQALAKKFKVRSIPTMILLKDGNEINRFVGVKNKEFLLKHLNQSK